MGRTNEIHVVGAGLAGLTAAAHLAEAGLPVVVHESRQRLGGRATTDERDGHRFNQGAHALYRTGPGAAVLADLGIPVRGATPTGTGVALLDGRIGELPAGPASLVRTRLLGARDKLDLARLLGALPRIDAAALAGTTVDAWLDDRLRRPGARRLVEGLVRLTTWVDDPGLLSADAAVGQLQLALGGGVAYVDGGWQTLVHALSERPGIRFEAGDGPVVDLPDAAAVVVATGGPDAAARLLGVDVDALRCGPAADVATLDLGLRGEPACSFALDLDGHRYLSQHSIAAGMAPAGSSNVSVARYVRSGTGDATSAEVDRSGLADLADRLGIGDDVVGTRRYLHRMAAVTAIPTARRGGLAGRAAVAAPDRPGVLLAGDWVGPVGHLADASLASGRAAARAAIAHVEHRPLVG